MTFWTRTLFIWLGTAFVLQCIVLMNMIYRLERIEAHDTITDLRLDYIEAVKMDATIEYYDDMEPYRGEYE